MARSCWRARSLASCVDKALQFLIRVEQSRKLQTNSIILVNAAVSNSRGLFCSSIITCSIHFALCRTRSAAGLYLQKTSMKTGTPHFLIVFRLNLGTSLNRLCFTSAAFIAASFANLYQCIIFKSWASALAEKFGSECPRPLVGGISGSWRGVAPCAGGNFVLLVSADIYENLTASEKNCGLMLFCRRIDTFLIN